MSPKITALRSAIFRSTLIIVFLTLLASEQSVASAPTSAAPLPSWNDGPAKTAILEFVARVTDPASHLSMAVGIKRAFERTAVNAITHDHDFHWERGDRYDSNFNLVNNLIENTFPLRLNNSKHAVINLAAQNLLKEKYGRDSVVVPNVMNFDKPFGRVTKRNKKLRKDIGLKKRDIPLFQITRIVRRKGIETAIDLVHRLNQLNKSNIKLVITGDHKDDNKRKYTKELINKIFKLKLNDHVIFANQYITSHFGKAPKIKSLYSLSDAYASAVACTYFSTYEGFGNAFVEAVLAKKPIFVNNYKPVFWPDIGSIGFKTVMLEDNKITDEAVEEINEVLHNAKLAKEIADHNFALGKEHFSYNVLKEKLKELLKF